MNGVSCTKDYYKSGQIRSEYYYLNGQYHRVNGPAVTYYYTSGQIQSEYYFINDEVHRVDGPAAIDYYKNGQIKSEYYYVKDVALTKEEFINSPEHQNYLADLAIDNMLEKKLWISQILTIIKVVK